MCVREHRGVYACVAVCTGVGLGDCDGLVHVRVMVVCMGRGVGTHTHLHGGGRVGCTCLRAQLRPPVSRPPCASTGSARWHARTHTHMEPSVLSEYMMSTTWNLAPSHLGSATMPQSGRSPKGVEWIVLSLGQFAVWAYYRSTTS